MKTLHNRNKTLIALAILAGSSTVVSLPAEAGRFGGGRSLGLGRASSHHSTVHESSHLAEAPTTAAHPAHETPTPGYVLRHPPLDLPAQPAPAVRYTADDISFARSANAMLRQSRLDDLRFQRMLAKHSRSSEPQPAPAYSETTTGGASSPRQPPTEPAPRVADPRFSQLTETVAKPETPCEIKPVMSDADYIACGATPPRFPSWH